MNKQLFSTSELCRKVVEEHPYENWTYVSNTNGYAKNEWVSHTTAINVDAIFRDGPVCWSSRKTYVVIRRFQRIGSEEVRFSISAYKQSPLEDVGRMMEPRWKLNGKLYEKICQFLWNPPKKRRKKKRREKRKDEKAHEKSNCEACREGIKHV